MSASITIIRFGTKCLVTYSGTEKELAEAFTASALRDEVISEAITRAAVEIELQRQTTQALIQMTQK